jgi:hypothetical protein
MVDLKFDFTSPSGNAYSIRLSSYDDSYFSNDVHKQISGIEIVNIDLSRVRGNKPTSIRELMKITSSIAHVFLEQDNVVICYYCDFLGPIPHTNKTLTCQDYRNRLFNLLFNRYIKEHNIDNISERIITIHGVEDYFVHIIYRQQHEKYVNLIAHSIHEGYDKP